jgi:hypothetical protein
MERNEISKHKKFKNRSKDFKKERRNGCSSAIYTQILQYFGQFKIIANEKYVQKSYHNMRVFNILLIKKLIKYNKEWYRE